MRLLPGIPQFQSACARIPSLTFAIAASVPLLLLILLAAGLTLGAGKARAQNVNGCGGQSLVTRLAASAPEKLAEARAEAAATRNGKGRLWKIEKPGIAASYLFGTMHVTDPRVIRMPEAVRTALDSVGTVVIETTDILDPAKAQAALLARPELTMFTDGASLSSYLNKEESELVEAELSRRGIPLALVSRMKPWMIAGMVALPDCELARKSAGVEFLDIKIARDAGKSGKTVLGLETIDEQMAAMASLPMEFHVRGLVETIRLADLMPDIMATMTDLYLEGEIALIMPTIIAASPETTGKDAASYAQFEQRIVITRNYLMAERAAPILARGAAFIAIGALHLPGGEGLVALLQDAGYTVTSLQ